MNKKIKFLTESVLRTIKESAENEMEYSDANFEYVKENFDKIFAMYVRLKNADERTLRSITLRQASKFLDDIYLLLGFTTEARHANEALEMWEELSGNPQALTSPKNVYRFIGLIMPSIKLFIEKMQEPEMDDDRPMV